MSLFSIFSKKTSEPTSVAEALAGVSEAPATKSKSRRSEKRHADSQNDQLIPEKKRARRRLIGAIAIVLAVVIGLPMVLDSEPKPLNKNILIQIPSKDSTSSAADQKQEVLQDEVAAQAVKQPLTDARQVALVQPDATPPTSIATEVATKSASPTKTDAKADNKGEAKADVKSDNKHVADSTSKKDSTTKAKADSKSTESPSTNSDESARALAILSGTEPAAKSQTRIVVQVGAFATQEKVNELQDKLNSAGIKSFTQKVATSSGDKIRVRIGPFSDKGSADKVKLQLEKLGLNGSLISL